jgi:hypothetical protein
MCLWVFSIFQFCLYISPGKNLKSYMRIGLSLQFSSFTGKKSGKFTPLTFLRPFLISKSQGWHRFCLFFMAQLVFRHHSFCSFSFCFSCFSSSCSAPLLGMTPSSDFKAFFLFQVRCRACRDPNLPIHRP